MTRKLTRITKIDKIVPHKNADRLEVAIIGGWPAVVRKGEFFEGDTVLFCEVDSLLPVAPAFDFLPDGTKHTEPDGVEYYRLRTVRLRGQLSQGLVVPVKVLLDFYPDTQPVPGQDIAEPDWARLDADFTRGDLSDWIGVCMDDFIGARKYEKPLSPNLQGTAIGHFPVFIPKTDEERIQNLSTDEVAGLPFFRTEKLDGSSCTVYRHGSHFGVCSRNLELAKNGDNSFWKAALEGNILRALVRHSQDYAIQGELCGPGIQGNRYELKTHEFFAFNVFNIMAGEYLPKLDFYQFCEDHGIRTVPFLSWKNCPESIDEILADAEGRSQLNSNVEREGVVWVNDDSGRISFKAISNKFLLGE